MTTTSLRSPRLLQLSRDLQNNPTQTLAAFWAEIEQQGTPLVEPLADDTDHMLVTFLWRASTPIQNVVVFGGFAHWDFGQNYLSLLSGTDVWYRTYRARADARMLYRFSVNDSGIAWYDALNWAERVASWQTDPLNSHVVEDWMPASVLELPHAPKPLWLSANQTVPTGQLDVFSDWASVLLGNTRPIWVYTPAQRSQNDAPPCLLVVFDGWSYVHLTPTPRILDQLIARAAIPPTVAVLVDHVDRGSELVGGSLFFQCLTEELLPWVQARYQATNDPQRTIIAGSSAGGFGALYAAAMHPERFGKVLAQSGAFAWKPDASDRYEWLAEYLARQQRLPLQVYLDVGYYDVTRIAHDSPTIREVNQHMYHVLLAREYPVTYHEYSGAHDYLGWRTTFGDALQTLLGSLEGQQA